MKLALLLPIAVASCSTAAIAQHEGHQGHSAHRGPGSGQPVDHTEMDHSASADTTLDHSETGHSSVHPQPSGNAEDPVEPPGSGPPRAADAIWGADAMRDSRAELARNHGRMALAWVQADRLELRVREGRDGFLWDAQGWYGGDIDKLWIKSEGEGEWDGSLEHAEVQGLWSHAIGPWFDLQAGVRQDLTGPSRTHAVIGVQGLAPYLFEVDAAAFVSNKGDLTARIEAELDQRITQRLILQPRVELALSAQDIPEMGVGAGIDHIEAGLRLRYELVPEFAPYIGVEQEWKLGGSADFARAEGEDVTVTNFVVGLRFWF